MRQAPTTAVRPTVFSLAVRKMRLRRRGVPDLKGANLAERRSMSTNLGARRRCVGMPWYAGADLAPPVYVGADVFTYQDHRQTFPSRWHRELVDDFAGTLRGGDGWLGAG